MSEFHVVNLPTNATLEQVSRLVGECVEKAKGFGQNVFMTPAVFMHCLIADAIERKGRVGVAPFAPTAMLAQVAYGPTKHPIYCAPSARMAPLVLGRFTPEVDQDAALMSLRCKHTPGLASFAGIKQEVIQDLIQPFQSKEEIESASQFIRSLLMGSDKVWNTIERLPLDRSHRMRASGEIMNLFLVQVKMCVKAGMVPNEELDRHYGGLGKTVLNDRELLAQVGGV